MAEGKLCVCPQCGKKFKLKAGFEAKSFACPACSGTVWVDGKPSAPKTRRSGTRRRSAGGKRAGATRSKTRGRAASPAPRTRAQREKPEHEERRSRYQSQQSNSTNVIIAVTGLVLIVGLVLFFVLKKDKNDEKTDVAQQPTKTQPADQPPVDTTPEPAKVTPEPGTGTTPTEDKPTTDGTPPGAADGDAQEAPPDKPRKLGKKGVKGKRKYDPQPDIPHLESTSPELRKQIDELIGMMMDPMAGRDSLDAKQKLIAIGKPAFPRILGAMAKVRDTITDIDSHEEKLMESSLKLADAALREMDGWLESHMKGLIRPGTDKAYITYILYLHNKRWLTKLKDMEEMPGPFDPSRMYEEEEEG